MKSLRILGILLVSSVTLFAQQTPIEKGLAEINKDVIKAQVEILAADWMLGRATATQGERMSADYIASMMQVFGAAPAGDKDYTEVSREDRWSGVRPEEYTTYFQNFDLLHINSDPEVKMSLKTKSKTGFVEHKFTYKTDFSVYRNAANITIDAPVVFVGYGLADEDSGYDDYAGIDVKGKIIVRLEGFPGHKDENSPGYGKFFDTQRYFRYYLNNKKDDLAEEHGAIAVIEIMEGKNFPNWDQNQYKVDLSENESPRAEMYDHSYRLIPNLNEVDPLQLYLTQAAATILMDENGIDLEQFEKQAANELKSMSKEIKNSTLNIDYNIKTDRVQVRNVVGMIEGEKTDEIIVLGAHYDHLGANDGFVWNGADDNASGTVGVVTIAKAIAATGVKPKRTIVFAAWTGEERGLLGSRYFVQNPYGEDLDQIVLNVNFDMISKDSKSDTLGNQTRMTYTEPYNDFEEVTKKHIEEYDLNLDMSYRSSKKPRGGSDYAPFAAKEIPIMAHMAGFPITYHTPKDGTSDINWEKMEDIIKLAFLNVWEFANSDEWQQVEE